MLTGVRFFRRALSRTANVSAAVAARPVLYSTAAGVRDVPIDLIKDLRLRTSAGYADCKKALQSSNNSIDDAVEWLRKKGALKAAAKADRVAAEGLVGAAVTPARDLGVVVEVNSESDFVARGQSFQELVRRITQTALDSAVESRGGQQPSIRQLEVEAVKQLPTSSGKTVADLISDAVGKLQENLTVRRAAVVSVSPGQGVVAKYIHGEISSDDHVSVGKIGGVVALKTEGFSKQDALDDMAHQIAMQVVGYSPSFSHRSEVPETVLEAHKKDFEKEQQEFLNAPKSKDEEQLAKRKFSPERVYREIVLGEQEFLGGVQKGKSVSDVLQDFSKKQGGSAEILGFVRVKVGEGITKQAENFAEEVQQVIRQVT